MRKAAAILLSILFLLSARMAGAEERITVFAAASLKEAMDRAAAAFEAEGGGEVAVSLAASSILARQVEAGAPADVFISADREWMDWLAGRGLVREESRRDVAANTLVIAGGAPSGAADPAAILSEGRFAMGDPAHVPAGRYARAALESLGLWEKVKGRAVHGENVRVALELARRGEVGAAIVYGSDLEAAGGLVPLHAFAPGTHPPIRYPAAATSRAGPEADAFLDFLSGPKGQAIFRELGFALP